MTYRWTVNLTDGVKVKSVSVNATNILEVISRATARYPGLEIIFAARMEGHAK